MDEPIRTATGDATFAYHNIRVEDTNPEYMDDPPSASWHPQDFLTARQGVVYIVSPTHTHTPVITLQAWGQEPPAQPQETWEVRQDAEVPYRSGHVEVIHAMGEKAGIELEIGSSGMTYALRVYGRGQQALTAIDEDPDTDLDSIDFDPYWHVEEYLLQFWPLRPIPPDTPAPFRLSPP